MRTAAAPWIAGPRFDALWFFGGAALSLAFLGLWAAGVSVVALFWIWIVALDGPHIAATLTRTYLDREEWRRRGRVLAVSLLSFAVGPVFLLLGVALDSPQPFLLFLGLSALYGYYHVVRQHYGFLALYHAAAGGSRASFAFARAALYAGCWIPYVHFLLTHPRARGALGLPPLLGGLEQALAQGLALAWMAGLVLLALRPGSRRGPVGAYLFVTLLLYGLVYFAVGPQEPTYPESNGPDQDFLLLSVLVTTFHNVQYLGLVWMHNRNRYAGEGDFGPARPLNATPFAYAAVCAAFSLTVYLAAACGTSVFPLCQAWPGTAMGPVTLSQLGLCLWWGLAIHHYVLDQTIWRVSTDAPLRRDLGLEAA